MAVFIVVYLTTVFISTATPYTASNVTIFVTEL